MYMYIHVLHKRYIYIHVHAQYICYMCMCAYKIKMLWLEPAMLLTLGAHAQEGYGTCPVCLFVCLLPLNRGHHSFLRSN